MIEILQLLIKAIQVLVFIRVFLSWVPNSGHSEFGRLVNALTDPIMKPFRFIIPIGNFGGMDLSPIIVIFILELISGLLIRF